MIRWYFCPMDTFNRGDRIGRRCAMHRYIPSIPNANGDTWEAIEILPGHCLVRVDARQAMLTTIEADADFLRAS